MSKYIDRELALWTVTKLEKTKFGYNFTAPQIKSALASIKAADVAPVVHGWWEIIEDDILCDTWIKCSVCGNEHETAYEQDLSSYSYCPNCGAKMDLEVSNAKRFPE